MKIVIATDHNGVEEKTAGAKYSCEVKEGTSYNFYVLKTPAEGDTTINLIMDQNINSDGTPAGMTGVTKDGENVYNLVAWINQGDYESVGGQKWDDWTDNNAFGPITAMNFLSEATKNWTNTNEIKTSTIAYENGTTYTMAKTYTTNARMPIYSGIEDESYEIISEKGEISKSRLNKSVKRILLMKIRRGIIPRNDQ